MQLHDYFTNQGSWLFRWRSFTPLLLFPLLWLERAHFHYPFASHAWDLAYEACCLLVALAGLALRAKAIGHAPLGTSGRISKRLRADVLNRTGAYSLVRNPLYLGNYVVFLGVTMMGQSWELILINSALFAAAYVPIILTEERFLVGRFGAEYVAYAEKVPCFIPRVSGYRMPAEPFRWRMVLRREPDTWMGSAGSFALIEHLREWQILGDFSAHWPWVGLAAGIATIWLVCKGLKKWTRVLALTA